MDMKLSYEEMMSKFAKVIIIDNSLDEPRLESLLTLFRTEEYIKIEDIAENTDKYIKYCSDFDLVVLSGSSKLAAMESVYKDEEGAKMISYIQAEKKLIRNISVPILGICFGHQMIAEAFESDFAVRRFKDEQIREASRLFINNEYMYYSHSYYVAKLPPHFEQIQTLHDDKDQVDYIVLMKHRSRKIVSIQGHPEYKTNKRIVMYILNMLINYN